MPYVLELKNDRIPTPGQSDPAQWPLFTPSAAGTAISAFRSSQSPYSKDVVVSIATSPIVPDLYEMNEQLTFMDDHPIEALRGVRTGTRSLLVVSRDGVISDAVKIVVQYATVSL